MNIKKTLLNPYSILLAAYFVAAGIILPLAVYHHTRDISGFEPETFGAKLIQNTVVVEDGRRIPVSTLRPFLTTGSMGSTTPTEGIEYNGDEIGSFGNQVYLPYDELKAGMWVVYYSEHKDRLLIHQISTKHFHSWTVHGIANDRHDSEYVTRNNYRHIVTEIYQLK